MSKYKLIDNAIEFFKGKFPYNVDDLIIISTQDNPYWGYGKYERFTGDFNDFSVAADGYNSWKLVCDMGQFNQRAKEIGWVNGVKQPLGNSEQLDNSWHNRGEFPPIGTECQVEYSGFWYDTYIVGLDSKGFPVFETPWDEEICYDSYSKDISTSKFRPIKSEREKFVEVATEIMMKNCNSYGKAAEALFDSGKFMLKE